MTRTAVPGDIVRRGAGDLCGSTLLVLASSFRPWAEGSCEPGRFIVAGDKIIVFVHVRVRLKDNEEWIEARLADV